MIKNTIIFIMLLAAPLFVVAQIQFGPKPKQTTTTISYSNPQELEIAEIKVNGASFLDERALISLTGLRVGDKITVPGDDIARVINKLWKQGLIADVSVTAQKIVDKKIYLVIEVKERPRLTKFLFSGLNQTQESDLEDEIELTKGRVLTESIKQNTKLKVEKYLNEKGYLNNEVKLSEQQDSILSNSVILKIDVDKNARVKIQDIDFIGDTIFTDKKLRKQLKKTAETPKVHLHKYIIGSTISLLPPKRLFHFINNRKEISEDEYTDFMSDNLNLNFLKSSKLNKEEYKEDKVKLISFYNSKGFRDATIVMDTIYMTSSKTMNIDFYLDVGRKYFIREIDWTGNYVYADSVLEETLGIKKGDVYNLEYLNERLNYNPTGSDVSSLYMDNGYLFYNVQPTEVAVDGDSIDLEMRMYEGGQATVKRVTISGNTRTNDHVVMRELRTLPGQKFNRSLIIRTQRELSQLQYFDPEKINPVPVPNPQDETVDIEWQLEEKSSDQLELSGGWGGSIGFVGTLGFSFNNFSIRNIVHRDKWKPLPFGDGQKLAVRAQANGRAYQNYSISFSEPWLGGRRPNSFGLSFNHSINRGIRAAGFDRRNTGGFGGNRRLIETGQKIKTYGASVSLGRRVQWPDDYFNISNSISYQNFDTQNYERFLGLADGSYNNFTFNTTVMRNSVDSPTFPRGGSAVSLSVSLTPPYSSFNNIDYETATSGERFKWIEYHKWMFDAKYYLTLVGNLVLAPRAHFGYVGTYNDETSIGPFERFSMGGDGIGGQSFILGRDVVGLRGYENNSINPTDNDIAGGLSFAKYVMELRYPISLNPSATIYAQAFAEAGNNWGLSSKINPFNLYRSAGVGLRIFMPAFGLLGIDWGYGFDIDPNSFEGKISGGQIHFSFGQQIR